MHSTEYHKLAHALKAYIKKHKLSIKSASELVEVLEWYLEKDKEFDINKFEQAIYQ